MCFTFISSGSQRFVHTKLSGTFILSVFTAANVQCGMDHHLERWSDGATSTYTFNTSFNTVNGLITAVLGVGTITDGRFKNATALSTFELGNFQAALSNSCGTTTGVTGVSGLSTLVITP
ncbi:hypothetical protein [Pseudomonas syringae]|uniref:hypothetical protein n=1 Tax=Pseudomonas syringae TaxID=317 RepID=UPI001E50E29E|nr:hypothetical protein [Pseudomonas syringae]